MKNPSALGSVPPALFLKKYWQKKPLLIRQAIPQVQHLSSPETLFGLAAQDDVESRLITNFNSRWKMQSGPLSALPSTRKKNWTLLVQGLNLHDDQAADLLHQFRFLPDARLDDLMVSYATDGGGVGAHFDSYDVFLLQTLGQRRWRIGAQKDLTLKSGLPLKILEHFIPEEEFILEPGDMLYLPPQYAHEGVAIGECMTCSIGFRAPSWQELAEAFLHFKADTLELPGRYTDPGLKVTGKPAKIDDSMLERIGRQLRRITASDEDIAIFLGEYLSEPKPSVIFDRVAKPLTLDRFRTAAITNGIRLHRKTRMLYRRKYLFINSESFQAVGLDQALLRKLADDRNLANEKLLSASTDLMESLYQWYRDGWLIPA